MRLLALAAIVATGLWVLTTAWQDLRAEMPTLSARNTLQTWQADERRVPSQAEWRGVEQDLSEGLQVQPRNPALLEALADLHQLGAEQAWATPEERQRLLKLAEAGYRQILSLRPRDSRNWTSLMVTLQLLGERGKPVNQAWAQARLHGPNEGYLVLLQLRTVLRTWPDATEEMRTWAADLYESGTQGQREEINRLAQPLGLLFSSKSAPRAPAAR